MGDAVDLQPWTWCWTSGCVDGPHPQEPVDFGDAKELALTFGEPGWTFHAIFQPAGQPCARAQTMPVEQVTDQEHLVRPAGPAGTYDVDLFGHGPQGDVAVTARWTTTTDGPMPAPTASLAVLADHDGTVDSYGIEFILDDLGATPEQAEATITVTSAEGRSTTFEAARVSGECQEEGWLFFDAPIERGVEAAALGSPPFTYDVDLVLDGRSHKATATWPDDVLEDAGPSVDLVFDPLLPALTS